MRQHFSAQGVGNTTANTRPVVADPRPRGPRGPQLQAEVDASGHITRQYIYLDGQLVACIDTQVPTSMWSRLQTSVWAWFGRVPDANGEVYAVHTDQRLAPVAVSNAQGQVIWRAHYSAFGQAHIEHPPVQHTASWSWIGEAHADAPSAFELNIRLPGQYFDAETGLHDNLQRSYDPQTGRYTTADPISMQAGLDLGQADRLAGGNVYAYVSSNPLTQIDPQGLYEEDVHYYTTFFLALVAGVDYNEARIIAMATQYIDDNPDTQPINKDKTGSPEFIKSIWTNAERLKDYHFTLADTQTGQTEAQYDNSQYANPSSPQLSKLMAASNNAPTRCAQLQFFGEYLHAFEDTFGHRGKDDKPIDAVWQVPFTDKQLGIGHGLYGHEPDKTYNETGVIALAPMANGDWTTREARTLQMNKEVFAKMGSFAKPGATTHSWSEVEKVMREFNAIKENGEQDGEADKEDGGVKFKQKIDRLNKAITAMHITRSDGSTPIDFSVGIGKGGEGYPDKDAPQEAIDNRNKFLCDKDGKRFNQSDYPGTILPKDTVPCK